LSVPSKRSELPLSRRAALGRLSAVLLLVAALTAAVAVPTGLALTAGANWT